MAKRLTVPNQNNNPASESTLPLSNLKIGMKKGRAKSTLPTIRVHLHELVWHQN